MSILHESRTSSGTLQVEPSSEMRKLLQAASKLQKKKGDSYLGAVAVCPFLHLIVLPPDPLSTHGTMPIQPFLKEFAAAVHCEVS